MSQDLYRAITDFAHGTPAWVHTFTEIGTDAGLFIFLALCIVAWWRARPAGARTMAIAALAPVATAFGYVVSETLKTFVQEERPCRAVVGAAASIAECPEYGDWSFPSNHSAIAGAFAMALVLAWRRTTWFVVPLAVLMAFSRVFVGVHYPHDVVAGLIVGALAVVLFVRLLTGPAVKLVETMRTSGSGAAHWLAGSGEAPSGTAAVAAGASAGRRPRGSHRQQRAVRGAGAGHREQPRQEVPERQEYPQYGDIGGQPHSEYQTSGGQQQYPRYEAAEGQQQHVPYQAAEGQQQYPQHQGAQAQQSPQDQGPEGWQQHPPYPQYPDSHTQQQPPQSPGNQGEQQHPRY
ncbi:phosphatase PAP2 family protein [Streptomyces sp. CC228A]|uniref:phosphatase PAP2 family protein n=1 Tax=Streptomyces sp. CC228A TaxID=2898186 RepID=UPI0027E5B359|nr:phosphatase PAP2 family protein [Streptomyces sp. CC228A]